MVRIERLRNTPTRIVKERNRSSQGGHWVRYEGWGAVGMGIQPTQKEAPVSAIVSLRGVSKVFPVQSGNRGATQQPRQTRGAGTRRQ